MENHSRRKSDAARRANQVIRNRTVVIMVLMGVVTFLLLFGKLYQLQILRHEELQAKAVEQQTRSAVISADRGTIYDRNQHALAISATAETVNISPKEIAEFVEKQQEDNAEAAAKAAEKGKTYTYKKVLDQTYIARGLARILELDPIAVEQRMERTYSQYETLKKKTDQTVANEVRRFINGEIDEEGNPIPEEDQRHLQGVWLQPDSKRYYPYGTLASTVIGFVNGENVGGVGLESKYEGALEGTSGLTISAKNAAGTEMLYQYEQYYDAENGSDLVLTIDTNVQLSLEKGMESMLEKFGAKNGGAGIVMEVDTGAILGMASYPNYDLNAYGQIYDEVLRTKLEASIAKIEAKRSSYDSEEAYEAAIAAAISEAVQSQWRNKCIDSTYEPGSTFKPITLAVALEEGLVSGNNTFQCSGSVMVPGWSKPFHCSRAAGHGTQTLAEAVGNSCNPAFISMGLKIGTQTYYKYLESFELMEKTGVDMIGEVSGIFADEKTFNSNVVSLASYSFGQTFNVTPLELIRAQAACINGGYLYTPYVVEQMLDDDGNVTYQHDATPVRQVVSEETSAKVRECLEYVVASGTGRNGQVAGYRIGGKTGTADKTGTVTADNPKGDIVVSFMCFAPADDPKYIMLLTMDTPRRDTGTYPSGGNMVAPTASAIMAEILPELGIEPDYSAEELVGIDAVVPYVVGETKDNAVARLESAGFACTTVGDGEKVTDQTPVGGTIVPNNATIILYLGEAKPDAPCTVPNVVGKTAAEANRLITNAGLIMRVEGATTTGTAAGNIRAISQDLAEGTELEAGGVVTVRFGTQSATAD